MATVTERLAILIEANAGQAVAAFKEVGVATKGLQGDVGAAGKTIGNFGQTASSVFGGLAGNAGALAAGAAVAKFAASGLTGWTNLVNEVRNFQNIAGGTSEDASRLVAAFDAVGVDATTAANGVFQLEKHLATGADKLAAFGVQAVKDKQGNTDMSATLLRVADAYKNMADPAQRAALLTAAFGRQGTSLVPLLAKSRSEIQAFFDEAARDNKIVHPEDEAAVIRYNNAIHNLKTSFTGLEEEAGKSLVPLAVGLADSATGVIHLTGELIKLVGWIDKIPGVGSAKKLGIDFSPINLAINPLGTIISSADQFIHRGQTATSTAHSLADGFDQIRGSAVAAGQAISDMDSLEKAIQGATDADRNLANAQRSQSDAQAAYDKLLKQGAVDLKAVAAAQTSVAEAGRSLGHAQREQAVAQDAYNKALAVANSLGTDTSKQAAADAANNLADANDAVANAQDGVNKANADLATAKAGDRDYQQKLADAKQKVADATENLSEKALADVKAHQAETNAMSDYADQLDRVLADYKGIIALNPQAALALAPDIAAVTAGKAAQPAVAPAGAAPPAQAIAPPAPTAAGGGTVAPGLSLPPAPPAGGTGGSVGAGFSLPTVQNNTFNNEFNYPIDEQNLSRHLIWQLGG